MQAMLECQRDLSVSYDKIGDVQVAQSDLAGALKSYPDSLAIRDQAGEIRPRQRGLAARSLGELQQVGRRAGRARRSRGRAEILSRQSRHFRRLAKSDPGNAGWQRDLSVSYGNLALAQKQSGDAAKARDFLRQGQAIMARLTKLSPDNAVWAKDLALFDGQIAALDQENAEAPPLGKGKGKAR